jgi:hypothetical protein
MSPEFAWVFNGAGARFPSGVFASRAEAEAWIRQNRLVGTLTRYPMGIGVLDWAVDKGYFQRRKPEHATSSFIGRFTSAHLEHYHFEAEDHAGSSD